MLEIDTEIINEGRHFNIETNTKLNTTRQKNYNLTRERYQTKCIKFSLDIRAKQREVVEK